MTLITLASLALSLVVINYLFRRTLESIKKKNIILYYLKRYLPVLELIGWSVFIIVFLNILFSSSQYSLYLNFLAFILIFIFVGWYFMRDFVAGVQIKTRFNLVKGQSFYSSQASGEIKKLGLLAITLKSGHGSDFIIPYAKLHQDTIQLNFHEKGEAKMKFTIELNKKTDQKRAVEKIEELIINSAWCSHKSKPKVMLIAELEDKNQYEIAFQSTVNDGAKKLKTMLTNYFAY